MKEWKDSSLSENHRIGDKLILLKKDEAPHNIDGIRQLKWYTVIICLQGSFEVEINYVKHIAQSPCLIALQAGQICKFTEQDSDCVYRAIMLSKEYFKYVFSEINTLYSITFILNKYPIHVVHNGDTSRVDLLFKYIEEILSSNITNHHEESVKYFLLSMFYAYGESRFFKTLSSSTRSVDVVQSFCTLLEENYRRDHTISYYAKRLEVSVNYLEKIVKKETGKTVLDCIEERVITEAKRLLISSSMSKAAISDYLGFSRQSAFSKFFRRIVGCTPSEFCSQK